MGYECGLIQSKTNLKIYMSKFITGKELGEAVDKIIWSAKEELLIVSPYIKLDKHFKELFEKQLHNHELHILLIFGKNEGRVDKSFNKADLEYFKQFPNISIVYVPNLHAKYYANEKMGIVTSINLYDFSFVNNIEFGVQYENKLLNIFSKSSSDAEVWNTCKDIANANDVIYINRPMYANYDYRGSKVLCDLTEELYSGMSITGGNQKLEDYEEDLDFDKIFSKIPSRTIVEKPARLTYDTPRPTTESTFEPGFCIRTGVKIAYNPERPLSYQAFKSWSKFGDESYAEKFCHYSGEPSNGETSVKRPILHKNWKQAQKIVKF